MCSVPLRWAASFYLGSRLGALLLWGGAVDRFGVFVDAGYLFAAAGELCCGTRDRSKLDLDPEAVAEGLAQLAAGKCELQHLRTYWYDGARDASPTAQHLAIAQLPGVKIRLGRLTTGGQKGVDSRIVRDLIILSQERAISVAFLLGGDEDLREGVSEAQERGVQVVLLTIEPLLRQNLSPTLAMEVDEIMVLGRDFLADKVRLKPAAGQPPLAEKQRPTPTEAGTDFAVQWLGRATPEEVARVKAARPRIPTELDRLLLETAVLALGRTHLEDDERATIRGAFWIAVLAAGEPSSAPSGI